MKIQPAQFPYFFYATLMDGGLYRSEIEEFKAAGQSSKAFTRGRLFYNPFSDEKGNDRI